VLVKSCPQSLQYGMDFTLAHGNVAGDLRVSVGSGERGPGATHPPKPKGVGTSS
jgi:hypothetical protein